MRKGITDTKLGTTAFTANALDKLQSQGYKFVQIRGLTIDRHYDYVEPHFLLLVPYKELPTQQASLDIYEPIKSELLYKWAAEKNEHLEIVIAGSLNN